MLAGVAASALMPAAAGSRPNILHIQSDQQQWATVAGRSECRTPNLNRMAREGMLFERSYTASAVCCPSRAITLSGAYHWHNGVYNQIHSAPSVKRDLNRDTVLYSQRLRDAGYRLGYVGKWHCSWVRTPADFGFESLANVFGCDPRALAALNLNPDRVERAPAARSTPVRNFTWPGGDTFAMWGWTGGTEQQTPEAYSTECSIRMMRRFAGQQGPWHLEVQYLQPHDPYMPLKSYLERYDPRSIPVARSFQDTFQNKPGLHRRESMSWERSPKTTTATRAPITMPRWSSWTRRSGGCWERSTKRARRTTRWWYSPRITATWWERTGCGSKAGFPTRSATAFR